MAKLALRALVSLLALTALSAAAGHIVQSWLRRSMPTPAQYLASEGVRLSRDTSDKLRAFDAVRVLEHGGPVWARWCQLSFVGHLRTRMCSNTEFVSDVIYHPSGFGLLLGQRDMVMMKRAQEASLARELIRWTGRPQAPGSAATDSIYKTFSLLHELAHFHLRQQHGESLTPNQTELYADRLAAAVLKQEFGAAGAAFAAHYRALHMFEGGIHDNHLGLARTPAPDWEQEASMQGAEQGSVAAYRSTAGFCFTESELKVRKSLFQTLTPALEAERLWHFMDCLALSHRLRPSADAMVFRRQQGMALAFDYFFPALFTRAATTP